MLTGDSLQTKTYRRCSSRAKKAMQSQMAEFLSALHAFPLAIAKRHRVPSMHPRKVFAQRMGTYRKNLLKTLTAKELKSVLTFLDESKSHVDDAYTPCFIHCDLYVDHIFTDNRHSKITGIIDFGDRAIFDPAIDFSGLWDYGREFVRNVYAQYTGPKDQTFLKRSWLRYKHGALGWLCAARQGKIENGKEAYEHFKKYFH